MKKAIAFILLLVACQSRGQVTTPILERTITVAIEREKLPEALARIASAGGFSFSYNANLIDPERIVSANSSDRRVREVLSQLLGTSVSYKERGNYIILIKAPPPKPVSEEIVFSGYVQDMDTGRPIENASLYEKRSLASAISDAYGFFRMRLSRPADSLVLFVSKIGYEDTVVQITKSEERLTTISLRPIPKIEDLIQPVEFVPTDTVPAEPLPPEAGPQATELAFEEAFTMPYEASPNVQNITDTLYRTYQASFIPFVGTNHRMSGNVINDYSFNLIGGYSLGTRKFELAGVFNIDRGDVSGAQVAGLINVNGGGVSGFQLAGFSNMNRGNVRAVQVAGFLNLDNRSSAGFQLAGFSNVAIGQVQGALVSGFTNMALSTEQSDGVQIAGFSNFNRGNLAGSQIAGFTNFVGKELRGSQISTFFNYGRSIKGSQVALFNYADSLTGVPIGLISIVAKGYHKIEVSSDEVFYLNLAFRTGVPSFYNILLAGVKPENLNDSLNVWTFGYGLGTAPRLARWLDVNLDVTAQHVNQGSFTEALSLLGKVSLGLDCHISRRFSLAVAGTLNGYLTDTSYGDYPQLFSNWQPAYIYDETYSNGNNLKMWWGGKVALRFL